MFHKTIGAPGGGGEGKSNTQMYQWFHSSGKPSNIV
jgi:hypothetical protein